MSDFDDLSRQQVHDSLAALLSRWRSAQKDPEHQPARVIEIEQPPRMAVCEECGRR